MARPLGLGGLPRGGALTMDEENMVEYVLKVPASLGLAAERLAAPGKTAEDQLAVWASAGELCGRIHGEKQDHRRQEKTR